jgi:hypothetical protein
MYAAWYSYQQPSNLTNGTVANGNTNYNDLSNNNQPTSPKGPKNIYIIRHGEKKQCSSGYCLDYNGATRACNLVTYFNDPNYFPEPIDYIVTCNPCPYNTDNSSMRPSQTIFPTSFMLNIPLFIYGGAQDFDSVADALFDDTTSNQYNGMNVLLCWEHTTIQALMLNLLNKAGIIAGRLPTNVVDTTNNLLTGSNFFKELASTSPSSSVNSSSPEYAISDGYYLSTNSKGETGTPYQVDLLANLPLPNYIDATDSKNLPYWNSHAFNLTYHIGTASGSTNANELNLFDILTQPINTCYTQSTIKIGLYQPLTSSCTPGNLYYNTTNNEIETKDKVPSLWAEP